ncbi:MBL fold metallo-hydrolase [Streptomyces sp. NPDC059740]|uniref:MBL fold metallo-hydrolase n=1 Tax=Streptomyces sp. NPDC059740 TaxID=3346926 RepID=UPI003651E2E7
MRLPQSLTQLADGIHLWSPTPSGEPTWGLANCVLIADGDEAALVDTPYDLTMTRALQKAAAAVLPAGVQVSTVVNTHPNGDHTFGNSAFEGAEFVSTAAFAEHLCGEPGPREMQVLVGQSDPEDPVGAYMRRHFGRFDYTTSEVVAPTLTFSGTHRFTVGATEVELTEVGPAHTAGDLIVHLPQQGVVCTGDVVFVGDHPVHWAGPLGRVVEVCEAVLASGAQTIVPGHGPVIGPEGLREYVGYVQDLRERLHAHHRAGLDSLEAAKAVLASGLGAELGLPERVVILAATEYRHLDGDDSGPNVLALASAAARYAYGASDQTVGG